MQTTDYGESIESMTVRLRRESMEQFYSRNPEALKILSELPKSELLYSKLPQLYRTIERRLKDGEKEKHLQDNAV